MEAEKYGKATNACRFVLGVGRFVLSFLITLYTLLGQQDTQTNKQTNRVYFINLLHFIVNFSQRIYFVFAAPVSWLRTKLTVHFFRLVV